MKKEIKIKLDLDASPALESMSKLEAQADKLTEKMRFKTEPEVVSEVMQESINPERIRTLINELNSLAADMYRNHPMTGTKSGQNNYKKEEKEFEKHQSDLISIERKGSQQRMNISEDEKSFKTRNLELVTDTSGMLFGRQGELYKTLSIAEATISAYNAANAALLPPPIGAGPILGEIQAGIVLMNSMKRVEKIAASKIPGYAGGGIVVGENGPEVIENMQDYAAGRAELIQKTIFALQNNLPAHSFSSEPLADEIKKLRNDITNILERPSIAYLNDREAKKIFYSGGFAARKNR